MTKYRLVHPMMVEVAPINHDNLSDMRFTIHFAAPPNKAWLGDKHEAEDIWEAYFKAVKAKKRCFDYLDYKKEKEKCEKEQESS